MFAIPLLSTLLLAAAAASAAAPAKPAPTPADPAVKAALDKLKINYELDDENDFTVVYEEKDGRSQKVLVRSPVETYGAHRIREVWAVGYRSDGDAFPAAVANRLLEHSHSIKMGGWSKQGRYAVFIVKIDAGASPEALRDAMEAASENADTIEKELTGAKDEF